MRHYRVKAYNSGNLVEIGKAKSKKGNLYEDMETNRRWDIERHHWGT
jgi:hypothetical protein